MRIFIPRAVKVVLSGRGTATLVARASGCSSSRRRCRAGEESSSSLLDSLSDSSSRTVCLVRYDTRDPSTYRCCDDGPTNLSAGCFNEARHWVLHRHSFNKLSVLCFTANAVLHIMHLAVVRFHVVHMPFTLHLLHASCGDC